MALNQEKQQPPSKKRTGPPKGSPQRGGIKKGTILAKTIEKEAARAQLRQIVLERLQELVDAQVENAMGLRYLVARNSKTGKFERVTSAMLEAEGTDHESIEVFEKDPSVQAFADLMDRSIDKPVSTTNVNLSVTEQAIENRLKGARKRTS